MNTKSKDKEMEDFKMKLSEVIIDTKKTVGGKLLVTGVKPAYTYENGQRTSNIGAYKYECVMVGHKYQPLTVKVEGAQRIDAPEDALEVSFDNLELYLYWAGTEYAVAARATDVHLVNKAG